MKKAFFLVISLLLASTCYCQDGFIKVGGKVIDNRTNEPLAYANVSISKSSIGTVSNTMGEFDFFIPYSFKDDTLVISYVGYTTLKQSIRVSTSQTNFYLDEAAVILNDVVVSSDGAKKIIETAIESIPIAYPNQPYLLEGFHRSWEKVDFTDSIAYPGTLIESAVTIYDPGYGQKKESPKYAEEIYLDEVRRSAIMEGWNYDGNWLKQLLQQNVLRHNKVNILFVKSFLDFPNTLVYEWSGSTKIDGENINIVTVEIPNNRKFPAMFTIYISEEDNTILRFDLKGNQKEIDFSQYDWHTEDISAIYIFRRYLGKSYLSYAKVQYTIKKLDLVKKTVVRTEDYFKELLINKIVNANVEAVRKSLGQISKANSLALQAKPYNQTFWEKFNLIKENPIDIEIISLFEERGKLKNQFKARTKKKDQ